MAITNLSDLLNAGAQYTAEAVLRRGGSPADVYRALQERFGSELDLNTRASVGYLIQRAESSIAASNELSVSEQVPTAAIPASTSRSQRNCFEYRVIVTGRIGRQEIRSVVIIKSDKNLSRSEIRQAAENAARSGQGAEYLPSVLANRALNQRLRNVTAGPIISAYRC